MANFERIDFCGAEWDKTLQSLPDANVFQSAAWLAFVAETQKGELVLAKLKEGHETLGYLCGLKVRKFGIPIFGSPFRGWSTPYMGFNLKPSVSRRLAVEALPRFAFGDLGCLHFELVDSHLSFADVLSLGLGETISHTMEIDLNQTEDHLFANMTKSCRWTVRKAEKNGLIIEEAADDEFAKEYGEQLKDVFAKQGRVPHFGTERVRVLLRHLRATGNLLLLRARDPSGACIATGIYAGMNQTAYYWGGASWRQHQKLYPNELLHWHAIRYWKSRGIKSYNMVGVMEFKQKFGGVQTSVPIITKSKYRWMAHLRSRAPAAAQSFMRLAWRLKNTGKGAPQN